MRTVCLWFATVLCVSASQTQGAVITIRTGQVGGVPGSCLGADDTFRRWAPQRLCSFPILSTPFQAADFDSACAGAPAVVVIPDPFAWVQSLACDPDARWIASQLSHLYPMQCAGERQSTLYCAPFTNQTECTVADSVRICWAVDDYLGDPPAFPGPSRCRPPRPMRRRACFFCRPAASVGRTRGSAPARSARAARRRWARSRGRRCLRAITSSRPCSMLRRTTGPMRSSSPGSLQWRRQSR